MGEHGTRKRAGGLADKIQNAMMELPELEELKDNVVATVTGDGLRIELLENDEGMFFQSGSPLPSDSGPGFPLS